MMDRAIRSNFGEKVIFPDGEIFYTFPKPQVLANLTANTLMKAKVGYRAEYILNAAKLVYKGDLNLVKLKEIPTSEGRKILTQLRGIRPKVADIILLYGLGKYFPWIDG